jgi:hypothetical protein
MGNIPTGITWQITTTEAVRVAVSARPGRCSCSGTATTREARRWHGTCQAFARDLPKRKSFHPRRSVMKSVDQVCAHKGCDCSLAADQRVARDGELYCSERCADGRGCDHQDCNCGDFPAAEPEPPYA